MLKRVFIQYKTFVNLIKKLIFYLLLTQGHNQLFIIRPTRARFAGGGGCGGPTPAGEHLQNAAWVGF